MEPLKSEKLQVYLVYEREDKTSLRIANQIGDYLKLHNIAVLYSESPILEDTYDARKGNNIYEADCILLMINEMAATSKMFQVEMNRIENAIAKSRNNVKLLPVITGEKVPKEVAKLKDKFYWDSKTSVEHILAYLLKHFGNNFEITPPAAKPTPKKKAAPSPTKAATKKESPTAANTEQQPTKAKHYLLKMTPETWHVEHLAVGEEAHFNTHLAKGSPRPEFELLKQVTKGDMVLGYASGSYQNIMCLFEVTHPVGNDELHGKCFKMTLTKIFDPRLPLRRFQSQLPDILERLLNTTLPPELVFHIPESVYEAILLLETTPEEESYKNPFVSSFLSEGDYTNTIDQLNFTADIESFATVITLDKVKPPLAIGLFGNWGTGKSFFMQKLEKSVNDRAGSNNMYVKNVVQVRFNSWHYSDGNLWASLVTEIFESLNNYVHQKKFGAEAVTEIYQKLGIKKGEEGATQQMLVKSNLKVQQLQEKIEEIDHDIKEKRNTLELFSAGELAQIAFRRPYIQERLKKVEEKLKVGETIDSFEQIQAQINDATAFGGKLKKSWQFFVENRSKGWLLLFGIIGGTVLLLLGANYLLVKYSVEIDSAIKWLVGIGTTLASMAVPLKKYYSKAKEWFGELQEIKAAVDQQEAKLADELETAKATLADELEQMKQERQALKKAQVNAKAEKDQLEQDLNHIASGKVLADFLNTKNEDTGYHDQLGLISRVRKDFVSLNNLFKQQKEAQKKGNSKEGTKVQIDRIVLYIDDLDRCNEDVVVKVLEAIHLLLAHELFVVVVGVDPRWLNNALSYKYKHLFGNNGAVPHSGGAIDKNNNSPHEITTFKGATSYDYLEKIFQIPFALRPMTDTGRCNLIESLVKEEMLKLDKHTNDNDEEEEEKDDQNTNVDTQNETEEGQADPNNEESDAADDNLNGDTGTATMANATVQGVKTNQAPAATEKKYLIITEDELKYMQHISPLFGSSPRTINRYVNIYRIIKAHERLAVAGEYGKDEFMPIMFMLALIVGHPAKAEKLLNALLEEPKNPTIRAFIAKTFEGDDKELLIKYAEDMQGLPIKHLKHNADIVSRFSFRVLLKESV